MEASVIPATRPAAHLAGLDLLRGIAAIVVMLHHAQFFHDVVGIWSHGYVAVDFFFLLSGFVMAIRYEGAMRAGLGAKPFMAARIRRLWPTMAMGIVLGAAVSGMDGVAIGALGAQMLVQFAFVPVFAGRFPLFPLNGVQWSLLVEFVANAVHATVLYRLGSCASLALLVPAAAGVWLLAYVHHGLGVGDLGSNAYAGFVRVGFSYLCGILLGRRWQAGVTVGPAMARAGTASLVGLPVVLLMGSGAIGRLWYFDAVLATLVFPLLLWLGAVAAIPLRLVRVAGVLGAISYPLYAFHLPFVRMGELIGGTLSPSSLAGVRAAALVLCLAAAWGWVRVTAPRAPASAPRVWREQAA